ncbi:MAG: SMC-Scp complex subunit ScpB [Bacteroidia bacterium]|nr:SMC-Scp complex subunit ScpB [Bacteroidia bacterium]
MEHLPQNIEALIFASENSITINEIQHCLKTVYGWELAIEDIRACIDDLQQKYNDPQFSFALAEIAEGFRFLTKPEFYGAIQIFIQQKNKKRLSTAALETLSIIAYRQPVSKAELEHVRGVSCDYSIQKLLEKELIEITGKSDAPGKPILYGTSKLFMDYFGLKDPKDLPKLKDLQAIDNVIGTSFESIDSELPEGITLEAASDATDTDDHTDTTQTNNDSGADPTPPIS